MSIAEELKTVTQQWKNININSEHAREDASNFYETKVFPLVKEAFIDQKSNRPSKSYSGLILPVGTSPEPLILSILALNPEKVHFLYTSKTEQYLDRIMVETDLSITRIGKDEIDGSNVVEIYRKVKEVLEDWGRESNIAVDISGGKKSMVSGASMAAAVIGADVFYVDNRKYLSQFRKPEPGSEFLNCLDNPYIVFGDLEVQSAAKLMESYDFLSARQIFERLEKQVPRTNYSKTYRAYRLLCEAYEAWDNLDFEQAYSSLNQLRATMKRKYTDLPPVAKLLFSELDTVEKQKDVAKYLSVVLAKDIDLEAFQDKKIFHLAFMLYYSAQRRKSQQKLDMATLLMYRLLEWIEQYRLAQYGIDTSKPNYSKLEVDEESIISKINEQCISRVKNFDEYRNLPKNISLLTGYMILAGLEDEVSKDINWGKFSGLLSMRNKSIFAHGFNNIKKKSYSNSEGLVKERFDQLCQIESIDRTEMTAVHSFLNPLDHSHRSKDLS